MSLQAPREIILKTGVCACGMIHHETKTGIIVITDGGTLGDTFGPPGLEVNCRIVKGISRGWVAS